MTLDDFLSGKTQKLKCPFLEDDHIEICNTEKYFIKNKEKYELKDEFKNRIKNHKDTIVVFYREILNNEFDTETCIKIIQDSMEANDNE